MDGRTSNCTGTDGKQAAITSTSSASDIYAGNASSIAATALEGIVNATTGAIVVPPHSSIQQTAGKKKKKIKKKKKKSKSSELLRIATPRSKQPPPPRSLLDRGTKREFFTRQPTDKDNFNFKDYLRMKVLSDEAEKESRNHKMEMAKVRTSK